MDEKYSIVRNCNEEGHDRYEFRLEGGIMTIEVDHKGGFVSTTEGIKEPCKFCGQSECDGDCDSAHAKDADNPNDYFYHERPQEIAWNRIVDGVEALTAQLCAAGKVDERSGGVRTLYIGDLHEAISLALEGAANNG